MSALGRFASLSFASLTFASLVVGGLAAQDTREAQRLFDAICEARSDRTLLFEDFEALDKAAIAVLLAELRAHTKALGERKGGPRAVLRVGGLPLGGAAGGRFGVRVDSPPGRPRRPDPLAAYRMKGELEIPQDRWRELHRRTRRGIGLVESRITLVLEGIRRFGPRALGATRDLITLAQAEVRSVYPRAVLVRALVAVGPRALPSIVSASSPIACRFALARSGAPGVRALMRKLREDAEDLASLQWTCRAIAASETWPAGVSAGPLLDCAFHRRSVVRDAARAALVAHAASLKNEISRWRGPDDFGTKQERFANALLGQHLDAPSSFKVVRRLIRRPRDDGRSRRRLGYEILTRRAEDFVRAGLGARGLALLEQRIPVAEASILETVALLAAHTSLRRALGKDAPEGVPGFYRVQLKARAWQRRLAALRCVQAGDEELAAELLPLLDDRKRELRIEAWEALAALRVAEDAELSSKLRQRIEALLLPFDSSSRTSPDLLVVRGALRACPALEGELGDALLDRLRAGLSEDKPLRWWARELFNAVAGLGEHARPLTKQLLEHRSTFRERALAIAATQKPEGPALAAFQSILRPRGIRELVPTMIARGQEQWIRALAECMRRCSDKDYDSYGFAWTGHRAFAALHVERVERMPGDLRDLGLRALADMGPKARGVRARLEALRDREKSRERRAALDEVLAAIGG